MPWRVVQMWMLWVHGSQLGSAFSIRWVSSESDLHRRRLVPISPAWLRAASRWVGCNHAYVSWHICAGWVTGIYGKQTSAFFQSLAWNSTIQNSVLFNGPRAGINFNGKLALCWLNPFADWFAFSMIQLAYLCVLNLIGDVDSWWSGVIRLVTFWWWTDGMGMFSLPDWDHDLLVDSRQCN